MKLDAQKLKIERNYVMGMHLSNGASRQYKYILTIDGNEFFKDEFCSETWTPKRGEFNWGKGETKYFFPNSKKEDAYDSILELLKSKYEIINQ